VQILAIVHQRDAGPGVFAEEIRERGEELDQWMIAEEAGPPADPGGYEAVMTFGGAMNTHEVEKHPWLLEEKELLGGLLDAGRPLLAVCLGTQLLAEAAGGSTRRAVEPEIGWFPVDLTEPGRADPLLGPGPPEFESFQWHSYEALPPDHTPLLAQSALCVQAYRIGERAWGIQFHAEVTASDVEKWIDDWRGDEDAIHTGLDPDALRAETREKIAGWNQLGRDLCGRFLDQVRSLR
jgi:GMP synthase (glutamine-hydrolysing)